MMVLGEMLRSLARSWVSRSCVMVGSCFFNIWVLISFVSDSYLIWVGV